MYLTTTRRASTFRDGEALIRPVLDECVLEGGEAFKDRRGLVGVSRSDEVPVDAVGLSGEGKELEFVGHL